jgi:hypothetical protein
VHRVGPISPGVAGGARPLPYDGLCTSGHVQEDEVRGVPDKAEVAKEKAAAWDGRGRGFPAAARERSERLRRVGGGAACGAGTLDPPTRSDVHPASLTI